MVLSKIAWRNLFLHRRKSLSALLAIMLAFASLSLFEGYIHDVKYLYEVTFARRQMLGTLLIEKAGIAHPGKAGVDDAALGTAEQAWIDSFVEQEKSRGTLETRVRFLNISGFLASARFNDVFIGLAYDPLEGASMRAPDFSWNTFAGDPLDRAPASSLLLGSGLATLLDCRGETAPPLGALGYPHENRPFRCEDENPNPSLQLQVTTEQGQQNSMDLPIAGLVSTGFSELDARMVMIPLATAHELFDTQRVSYYSVRLVPGADAAAWLARFQAAAARDGVKVQALLWKDHALFGDLYRRSLDFLDIFRSFIISIILVVVVMAIMNNFVRIVHERRFEIGTLRSLGYRGTHILAIFTWESFFLAAVGSCLGVLLAYGSAFFCNRIGLLYDAGFLSEGVPFRIAIQAQDIPWIACLIIILTTLATMLACWRTSRRPLVELVPKS